ncbi:hypothetical protein F4805DRAFT_415279 [Annulohypoxylon moriforme]|nr:hypothetical protein F4805DRAFT_415279 [Annulohypoxylon moriforme]
MATTPSSLSPVPSPTQPSNIRRLNPNRSTLSAIEKWNKSHHDRNFAKKFETHVKTLHDDIIKELQLAESQRNDVKDNIHREISQFLGDGNHINRETGQGGNRSVIMDNCVRWVILCTAALAKEKDVIEAEVRLINMILKDFSHLAFENVNMVPLTGDCKSKDTAMKHYEGTELKSNKSTPFHQAIQANNPEAVKAFLRGITEYCEKAARDGRLPRRLPDWLKPKNATPENLQLYIVQRVLPYYNQTPLQLAAQADGRGEVLECLLSSVPRIVEEDDKPFIDALDDGKFDILNKFLSNDTVRTKFATSEYIIKAIISLDENRGGSLDEQRMDIVLKLIEMAKKNEPSFFNFEVVQAIIEHNLRRAWELVDSYELEIPPYALHIAVMNQNLEFVELILKDHSDFVTKKEALPPSTNESYKQYPLWYNNKHANFEGKGQARPKPAAEDSGYKIRSQIITHTVRQVRRMKDLSEIFAESGEPARELCFDLSHINFQSHLVSEFVQSLVNHSENKQLLRVRKIKRNR